MVNGFTTGIALVISFLILILFCSKKNVDNVETKIFKKMLFCNLCESLSTTSIVVVALSTNNTFILKILNRIDVMLIILWCSLMFIYIYSISTKFINKNIKNYICGLNIVILIFALFLNVNIINENGVLNSDGPLTYLGFIGAIIYLFLMIVTLIFFKNKSKNVNGKKYMPLYILITMLIVVALLRLAVPEVNLISIVLSLVDMIMIFTIENPDIKMLGQLEVAKRQVEKSNKVKSDFLSSMSHEIRTPLNAIIGYNQMIEYSETLEDAKENAREAIKSSNTLLNMISNILDISQVEANNLELTETEYNFEDLMQSLKALFCYKLEEKNVDLKINISSVPKSLIGDVDKIKRIFANLIDNAIKYTDEGVIKIIVVGKASNQICKLNIEVSDTGKGIDEKVQKNLFNNFIRDEESMDSSKSGMGLGLSITKSLIEYMGGSISFESTLGRGTTFKIKLDQRMNNNESTNS